MKIRLEIASFILTLFSLLLYFVILPYIFPRSYIIGAFAMPKFVISSAPIIISLILGFISLKNMNEMKKFKGQNFAYCAIILDVFLIIIGLLSLYIR